MTKEAFLEFCRSLPDTVLDQPFEDDYTSWVARHRQTRKWFALLMHVNGKDIVNLKCDPMETGSLRAAWEGILPAYHMNKEHWNTLLIADLPDDLIRSLTVNSYHLTEKKKRKASKKASS